MSVWTWLLGIIAIIVGVLLACHWQRVAGDDGIEVKRR